ncbi:MAG: hypothetical protein HeimAB125_02700 [Candidatus Heimdallarchaeota archaeon AB_125]|nr:MAG: hypothetical protein HeimAB125_02700 [Candidatus Heimdallarchaeota archaeon AB_125]
MEKDIEELINSIPKLSQRKGENLTVLILEDMVTEKPRASVKEIDGLYKLIKILKNSDEFSYNPNESKKK